MPTHLRLWQRPKPGLSLIAGWHQWADAGSVSSGLPQYLVEQTRAARIGRIEAGECYLFQLPGTHHLLRPVVKLAEGHRIALEQPENEFYLASACGREFIVFLGTEPHRRESAYADAVLAAIEALGVRVTASVAGVHGPVPHWRERSISCVCNTAALKARLAALNVRFSEYEGGATIGMVMASRAMGRGIPFARLCAYVPTYDFSGGPATIHRMAMEEDYLGWRSVMIRLNRLLGLFVDLPDLAARGESLTESWNSQIDELAASMPQLRVREYLDQMEEEYDASGGGKGDLWSSALRAILGGDS